MFAPQYFGSRPDSAAVPHNITVVPSGPLGFLSAAPSPITLPARSSTLNVLSRAVPANAATVPVGWPDGSIDIYVSNTTEVIIDINGYYAMQMGVALAQGTASAPSLSFAGDSGTGLFSSGAGFLDFVTAGASRLTIRSDGDLELPGSIRKAGDLFLHANNTVV